MGVIENADAIVLDAANNVIVRPDGDFKIVADFFDGNTIKAWSMEGPDGSRSSNLAGFSGGKHLDAVVNRANGTVNAYYGRLAGERLLHYLPDVPPGALAPAE